ncbi:amino acid aminotransferase [Glacieibacterium sp.]|uniref:amino acid aminotransferase n=1 Tax=Glacieibacterium sp. TaxID=2860237 RepID=UPI003AFFC072
MIAAANMSMRSSALLDALLPQPADALLALIGLHRDDPRSGKIDVGVGVYRDETGATPIMRAVKVAELRLLAGQTSKSYLGPEGDARFTDLIAAVAFGSEAARSERLTGVQTPGGTGALRLGAEVIARANPTARVWIGAPTWPNHGPIFREAGLRVESHAFYDVATSTLDFDGMMSAISGASAGDVLLLHGCCHNPSGAEFSIDQWRELAEFCSDQGVIPFVDLAYQGLGNGLDEDAAGLRSLLAVVPEALVAYSCDKNFGLYRERVGALFVIANSRKSVQAIRDNTLVLARSLWSMPPDHGAAVVRLILDDTELTTAWRDELDEMRLRINRMRALVAAAHPRLAPIGSQRGMFAMLPIDGSAVAELRRRHGIYMAGSGRINVAGLQDENIAAFTAALVPLLVP